jgi:hypothetical protein
MADQHQIEHVTSVGGSGGRMETTSSPRGNRGGDNLFKNLDTKRLNFATLCNSNQHGTEISTEQKSATAHDDLSERVHTEAPDEPAEDKRKELQKWPRP